MKRNALNSHFGIPAQVRPVLYALADLVDEKGHAALTSSEDYHFSHNQAFVYRNYYDGLRRFHQVDSILHNLYTRDDPHWGWGSLGFHEAIVVQTVQFEDPDPLNKVQRARILELKRRTPGRLEIYKRDRPMPSVAMQIIYATLGEPVFVRGVHSRSLLARRRGLAQQITDQGLLEKLNRLRFEQKHNGVLIGTAKYHIE